MTLKAFAKVLIINDAGELLCLRRSSTDFDRPGGWDFPGGTLEPGEGFMAGVLRETMEEAHINLSAPFLAYSRSEERDWGVGIWLYYVQYVAGRPPVRLSPEHDDYAWMKADAFLEASKYPKHHDIITFLLDNGMFSPNAAHTAVVTGRMVVLNKTGEMLILRRSATDPFHPGAWDLPGGRAELGEDLHETASRETQEETGIMLTSTRAVFATSRKRTEGTGTWIFFAGSVGRPEISLSNEHDDYKWITPEALPDYASYDVLLEMSTFVRTHKLI